MNKNIIAHNTDSGDRTKDVTIQENVTFQSMFLSQKVLEGLTSCGFRKPSPIQVNAIPVGRCGFDLIVKSKSGTGKTVVFSVIALEIINTEIRDLQVLILAPTREISVQIAEVIRSLGKNIDDLKVNSFIGGSREKDDVEKALNCQIAVGAPGRVKSLIKQNILKVDSLKLFVLDEADKLMDNNFRNDLNEIYYNLPLRKQIIAISATFPKDLKDFLGNYMQSPTQITVEFETPLLLGLKQYIKEVKQSSNSIQEMKHKNEELLELLETISFTQCLVFSNYQTRAETVSLMLNRCGWNSTFISAAQTQVKRLEAIENLKNLKCRILLSTDLTARGIDMVNIDLIINYDVPSDVITYLHRMGRAGRYGSRGLCVTLVSGTNDKKKIQKFLGIIGGKNLTIAKLPGIKQRKVDLWEANTMEFEQLTGMVEEDVENRSLSSSIQNEILNLKTKKLHSNNTVGDKEIKFDDNFLGKNTLDHLNSLNVKETKFELPKSKMECENVYMQMDHSRVVLESMARGMFNFQSISEFESIEVTVPKSLEKLSTFILNQNLEEVDTYYSGPFASRDVCLDNIFLHTYQFAVEDNYHWKFLVPESELSKKDQMEVEVTHEYGDNNSVESSEENDDSSGIQYNENGKRIYAYKEIPNRMVWVPVDNCVLVSNNKNSQINLLESVDFTYDENTKDALQMISTKTDDKESDAFSTKWSNPKLKLTKSDQRIHSHNMNILESSGQMDYSRRNFSPDHYIACLNQCSEELWQDGLRLNSVENFDYWFYDWQQRVQHVSDYIRQNIYVKELSYYQNRKDENRD